MAKHTPLMRLQAARRAKHAAEECCPHWDYESSGEHCEGMQPCCDALRLAAREVRLAKQAMEKTQ